MSAPAATDTPDRTLALVPDSVRTRRTAVAFDAGVLLRITRLAMAHPWRMGLGFAATLFAAAAQLVIPQLIGEAVDHAHGLLAAAGDDAEARAALAHAAWLILAGSLLIERVFGIPGMGLLFFEAITARDYPVVMGYIFISSALLLVGNLLSDLCVAWVDPRVRFGE